MVSNKVEYIVFRMSIVLISKVDEMVLEIRSVKPGSEVLVITWFDFVVVFETIEVVSSVGIDVFAIEEVVSEISSEVETYTVVSDFDVESLVIEETISTNGS